mgnify:CR=1
MGKLIQYCECGLTLADFDLIDKEHIECPRCGLIQEYTHSTKEQLEQKALEAHEHYIETHRGSTKDDVIDEAPDGVSDEVKEMIKGNKNVQTDFAKSVV